MRHFALAGILLILRTTTAVSQADSTISVRGIGGFRLCQPMSTVRPRFPLARDTIIESEGAKWPAKVVPAGDGQILFEASWIDTTHVWRIGTNSARYPTPHGYRVGMTLGDVRARGEKLRFSYAEGYIVITLLSDQVDFLPDDSTARAFLSRSPRAFDSLEALPRSARIKDLGVSADCRH
jgi:hypothetical protein